MKYFKESEFVMGGVIVFDKMDEVFLDLLDELREVCGFPIRFNSTYRDPAYNKKIGGSSGSKHLLGIAADISCLDSSQRVVIVGHAIRLGLTVGVAGTFIHVDNREKQIMFTY